MEPGSTPSVHTGELPSLVLLWLTVLASGDQSVVQAVTQQFPYTKEPSDGILNTCTDS